jgi:hypothetical protein
MKPAKFRILVSCVNGVLYRNTSACVIEQPVRTVAVQVAPV